VNCPICKYSDEERDFKLEAAQIKRRMPKYMRDKISMVIRETSAVVNVSSEDVYRLVYAIRHFGHQPSEKAIDDYHYYGYYRQGKGLNYLIGMIRGMSKDIESQMKYENTLQAIPPEVEKQ